jgi:hypothetical protein
MKYVMTVLFEWKITTSEQCIQVCSMFLERIVTTSKQYALKYGMSMFLKLDVATLSIEI